MNNLTVKTKETQFTVACEEYESMTDEEKEAAYDALPWIKAIIVNIDTP